MSGLHEHGAEAFGSLKDRRVFISNFQNWLLWENVAVNSGFGGGKHVCHYVSSLHQVNTEMVFLKAMAAAFYNVPSLPFKIILRVESMVYLQSKNVSVR
jgi:hypothetical protein